MRPFYRVLSDNNIKSDNGKYIKNKNESTTEFRKENGLKVNYLLS